MNPVEARLHCQRANCDWDSRLCGEWIVVVWFTVSSVVVAGLVVGAAMGVTLLDVVLGVAAGTRLLAWLVLEQRGHSTARKRMQNLHGYMSRAGTDGGPATAADAHLVQAAIFEHRRGCPSVPDWYYGARRKAYERKAEALSCGSSSQRAGRRRVGRVVRGFGGRRPRSCARGEWSLHSVGRWCAGSRRVA